jgi:hypothetical protein
MPSTYTVNLGIEKPLTGEQSGTWGDTTNINFDILDQAINGAVTITLASAGTSGSPNTLSISDGSVSDGRNKWIEFVDGGDLGATAYVQLTPNDAEKIVFIRNSLSGSRSVILFQGTYDAARDLEVPAGVDMVVKFSGGGATATTTNIFHNLAATGLTVTGTGTFAGATIADGGTVTTIDINGGTIDGTAIGGSTTAAGAFTTLAASSNVSFDGGTIKLDGNYPVGTGNVALGDTALVSLTSGGSNTAIGPQALNANTSGGGNTAVGYQAGQNATTASYTVALGYQAIGLGVLTGAGNIAVGYQAGYDLTSGLTTYFRGIWQGLTQPLPVTLSLLVEMQ